MENIGNNVTLELGEMDFGETGASAVVLGGHTPLEKNTIHIRFTREGEAQVQIVEFPHSDDYREKKFALEPMSGVYTMELVFLPGSHFDFQFLQFVK